MKVDKEQLIKHRFWIGVGALVPLVLVCLFILWSDAAGAVEEKTKAIEEIKTKLNDIKDPPNDDWLAALKKREAAVAVKETEIWGTAWKRQEADFTTWPAPTGRGYSVDLTKLYWGDEIPPDDRDLYKQEGVYNSQVEQLPDVVLPVDETGRGAVQFKGGPDKVIHSVPAWADPTPTSEELWLAQEDVWVQRELLRIVRRANDSVAELRNVSGTPAGRKGGTFENAEWRLELGFGRAGGKPIFTGQIRNLTKRLQPLGVHFTVRVKEALGSDLVEEDLFVEGTPLAPGKSADINPLPDKKKQMQNVRDPAGIESVVQAYDWRTAAVKRIDRLALGYLSDEEHGAPLVPDDKAFKPAGGGEKGGAGGKPNLGADAPKGGLPGMTAGAGTGGTSGGSSGNKTPINGLERNRYLKVIHPQVRRLPLGLVLIVDPGHIQDVLAAVANSNMRIQITQVQWQHYRAQDLKPKGDNKPGPGPKREPRPGPAAGGRPGAGAMPLPGAGVPGPAGGMPGMGPGASGPAGKAEAAEEPTNVVELAVYGIASLYGRYPSKAEVEAKAKEAEKAKGTTTASGQPGAAPGPKK